MNVKGLYNDLYNKMEEHYPSFTEVFLHLGDPFEMDDSPFAYVQWLKDVPDKDFQFYLNVENVSKLDVFDQLFVCIHETFHVILNHDKLKLENKRKLNVAADIVINDYLVVRGLQPMAGLLYGEEQIGFNSYGLSVSEVYDLLPDQPEDSMVECSCQRGEHGDGDAEGNGEGLGGGLPDDILGQFQDFMDNQSDEQYKSGKMAGTGTTDMQQWQEKHGASLKWAELLQLMDPDMFRTYGNLGRTKRQWHRPARKIAWAAPKVLLPSPRPAPLPHGNEGTMKPRIVMAIDTSGSITKFQRDTFFSLVKSIPTDKVELQCMWFTSSYGVFDPDENMSFPSGGTDFSAIETGIQRSFISDTGKYPSAVVVITDGYAKFYKNRPAPQDLKNWYWLVDPAVQSLPSDIGLASGGVWKMSDFVAKP